jgi:hypothetical protein
VLVLRVAPVLLSIEGNTVLGAFHRNGWVQALKAGGSWPKPKRIDFCVCAARSGLARYSIQGGIDADQRALEKCSVLRLNGLRGVSERAIERSRRDERPQRGQDTLGRILHA